MEPNEPVDGHIDEPDNGTGDAGDDTDDRGDDGRWGRPLLVGLAALVGITLIIGGVISAVAVGAAHLTGLNTAGSVSTGKPSLYMPSPGHISGEPSPASPNVTTSPTKTPTSTGSPSSRDTKSRHHHRRAAISLQAFPRSVSASQKIHLTGVDSREGAVLQVQRLEGTWADFPVTATVRGGIFQTYIYTGNTGVNRFRMYDKATGKISNVVRVTIH